MDEASTEENIGRMEEAFGHIKTGEVALASRSTVQGGVEVLSGDSIGIFKGKIQVSCAQAEDAALGLVTAMIGPYDEIVTLYYGESIQKEEAEVLAVCLEATA